MRQNLPVVYGVDSRDLSKVSGAQELKYDSFLQNLYVQESSNKSVYVKKRPAFHLAYKDSTHTVPYTTAQPVSGAIAGAAYAANSLCFSYYSGTAGSNVLEKFGVGALSSGLGVGSNSRYWIKEVDSSISASWTSTAIMLNTFNGLYVIRSDLASSSAVSGAASLAGGVAYLDGFTFYGTIAGQIYNCAVNDPLTWAGTDFVSAEESPDSLYYITDFQQHVIAFGGSTIEFFYNAGSPTGSPLARRQDIIHRIGISPTNLTRGSPIWSDDKLICFVGSNQKGRLGVYLLDESLSLEKISDEFIDSYLNSQEGSATLPSIYAFVLNGRYFISLNIRQPTSWGSATFSNHTFVFDVLHRLWTRWTSTADSLVFPQIGAYGMSFYNSATGQTIGSVASSTQVSQYFFSEGANGDNIWILTTDFFQDEDATTASLPIECAIQTKKFVGNSPGYQSSRKYQRDMAVVSDRGSLPNNISISYSDDDYESWSSPRTLDLSNPKLQLSAMGSFYERAWKLVHNGNQDLRIVGIETSISTGFS